MSADPILFRDLAYVFVAALLGGSLAWLARQPLILGYVLGGLIISPLTPGPAVSDIHTFELFAEIGVVLLMFSLGIEFSLKDLMGVGWIAVLGGPIGMILSILLGLGVGALLGWSPLQGAMVGMVVSPASTMVLARLLLDRGELHTRHGRVMIGITLVEDLAVVVLIVLIPAFGAMQGERVLAVASVPDEKKGERLVVLHLGLDGADARQLSKGLSGRGLPNLWVPGERDFYPVDHLPVLGSGKLDLKQVKEMALSAVQGSPAAV